MNHNDLTEPNTSGACPRCMDTSTEDLVDEHALAHSADHLMLALHLFEELSRRDNTPEAFAA